MTGDCNSCGEHCLDCRCLLSNKIQAFYRQHSNVADQVYNDMNTKIIPIQDGVNMHQNKISQKKINNFMSRESHEDLVKNTFKCKELGLDQHYEIMMYLKKWGNWLQKSNDEIHI